jgi:hypothetical protein
LLFHLSRGEHQHRGQRRRAHKTAGSSAKKSLNVRAGCAVKKLRTHSIEAEAQLITESSRGWTARSIIVASIALAFGLIGAQQSFAGCGGYCEARQARAMCHQAVEVQGLKAREGEVEFEKCKADPASYLDLEALTGDEEMSVE